MYYGWVSLYLDVAPITLSCSVLTESIRKYPGLPFLNRECTQDFLVPGSNYTIKQGTGILISLFGLHRDASYFPNPEDYDPHRFDADNMNYDQTAFMPFGEGPRHCIGACSLLYLIIHIFRSIPYSSSAHGQG